MALPLSSYWYSVPAKGQQLIIIVVTPGPFHAVLREAVADRVVVEALILLAGCVHLHIGQAREGVVGKIIRAALGLLAQDIADAIIAVGIVKHNILAGIFGEDLRDPHQGIVGVFPPSATGINDGVGARPFVGGIADGTGPRQADAAQFVVLAVSVFGSRAVRHGEAVLLAVGRVAVAEAFREAEACPDPCRGVFVSFCLRALSL